MTAEANTEARTGLLEFTVPCGGCPDCGVNPNCIQYPFRLPYGGHQGGYIFNDDPDVLRQAARDRGWIILTASGIGDQNDKVTIVQVSPDGRQGKIAQVNRGSKQQKEPNDDGLRGQDALETALHRADLATKEA